jgi:hypothetical protein
VKASKKNIKRQSVVKVNKRQIFLAGRKYGRREGKRRGRGERKEEERIFLGRRVTFI